MTKFAETPEGREYLAGLQGGTGKTVPDGMSELEAQVFKMFHERRKAAGVVIAERDRLVKRIADDEARVRALTRQGDMATGEATAFAEILLAAEEARRTTVESKPSEDIKIKADGNDNGQSDNEDCAPQIDPAVKEADGAKPVPRSSGVASVLSSPVN